MKDIIEKIFNFEINNMFPKREVRNFLINHERKNIFLENTEREIKLAQHKLKKKDLQPLIKDLIRMFAKAALAKKEDEISSKIEIGRRVKRREQEIEQNTHGADSVTEIDRSISLESK